MTLLLQILVFSTSQGRGEEEDDLKFKHSIILKSKGSTHT